MEKNHYLLQSFCVFFLNWCVALRFRTFSFIYNVCFAKFVSLNVKNDR